MADFSLSQIKPFIISVFLSKFVNRDSDCKYSCIKPFLTMCKIFNLFVTLLDIASFFNFFYFNFQNEENFKNTHTSGFQ